MRCTDGVVIGADGSATFTHGRQLTIEQPTKKKIEIIDDHLIVAGSGYVGHAQRFCNVVKKLWRGGAFKGKDPVDIGKMLAAAGISDFQETHVKELDLSALVAGAVGNKPFLCEIPAALGFQPEIKDLDDIWYVSVGSGQPIVDPFLAFLRSVFWKEGPPNLRGGTFLTLWALLHACEVNPGGINEPIGIAVLEGKKGKFRARQLLEHELAEHRNMVQSAKGHMASFRETLLGHIGADDIPRLPK